MTSINVLLASLAAVAKGPATDRVQVERGMLAELHELLLDGEQAKRERSALMAEKQARDVFDRVLDNLVAPGRA